MFKTIMMTTALTGMLAGGALAQTTPSQTEPMQPQATQPVSPGTNAAERAANSSPSMTRGEARFINSQATDQWLSSNFIGVDVVGPDDEKIGDVTDILFEKNGSVIGYVVGVGGFLGIGAKNVALAPTSFEVIAAEADRGTTGSAASTAARADNVKLKLNMTKDQLKQASSFETKREQDSKARAAQPAPGGMNRPAR